MAAKGRVGKPPKFKTPREMQLAVEAYAASSPKKRTVTGLAIALGFTSRQALHDQSNRIDNKELDEKGKLSYSDVLKAALLWVENGYEERLCDPACTGSIFALKNMGWTDRQEIKHDGLPTPPQTMEVKIINATD